jgi:hypothetical protein
MGWRGRSGEEMLCDVNVRGGRSECRSGFAKRYLVEIMRGYWSLRTRGFGAHSDMSILVIREPCMLLHRQASRPMSAVIDDSLREAEDSSYSDYIGNIT